MTVRCPSCRTRRATFVSLLAHQSASGHKLCRCGGYHYPHRPASRCCEENALSPLYRAHREGVDEEDAYDIMIECALSGRAGVYRGKECPF